MYNRFKPLYGAQVNSSNRGLPHPRMMCNGLQTVVRGLANKRSFRLTFCANKLKVRLTITANEPTFHANSLQTMR
jgi:hypothetical protein